MRHLLAIAFCLTACRGDGITDDLRPDRFTAISAGYYHTCALTALGRVYCWGANEFGSLGDGTRAASLVPTPVTGGTAMATIDVGAGHSCALRADARAYCWGQNDEGQLGDGTFTVRAVPAAVAGGIGFTSISAGHAHTCATTADGNAYCWGDDSRGQLGDGASALTRSATPVRVRLDVPVAAVHAGYYQSCALLRDGRVFCWGANDVLQGGGGTEDTHIPVAVSRIAEIRVLAPGDRFVCAAGTTDTWCWGGPPAVGAPTAPARVAQSPAFASLTAAIGASTVSTAEPYVCGITPAGAAHCWGGAIRALRSASNTPVRLPAPRPLRSVTAGAQHVCALDDRGDAWCGGANYAGQLGVGSRTDQPQLTQVRLTPR